MVLYILNGGTGMTNNSKPPIEKDDGSVDFAVAYAGGRPQTPQERRGPPTSQPK